MNQRQGPLTSAEIIEAALRLGADPTGEGITFRRLGKELGVDPTAIYRRFSDKDAILLTAADELLRRALAEVSDGLCPKERLQELARQVIGFYVAYPHIGVAGACRTTHQPGELAVAEYIVAALREFGLDEANTALYYRTLADTVLAIAGTWAQYALLENQQRSRDETAIIVSQKHYPNLAELAAPLAAVSHESIVDTLFDLLWRGINSHKIS